MEEMVRHLKKNTKGFVNTNGCTPWWSQKVYQDFESGKPRGSFVDLKILRNLTQRKGDDWGKTCHESELDTANL